MAVTIPTTISFAPVKIGSTYYFSLNTTTTAPLTAFEISCPDDVTVYDGSAWSASWAVGAVSAGTTAFNFKYAPSEIGVTPSPIGYSWFVGGTATTFDSSVYGLPQYSDFSMLKLNEGSHERYRKTIETQNSANTTYYYVKKGDKGYDSNGNYVVCTASTTLVPAYIYNRESGKMVSAVSGATHGRAQKHYYFQQSSAAFDRYFETANVIFNRDQFNDSVVQAFIKTCVSVAQIYINYTSDGNYNFSVDKVTARDMGRTTQTAAWSNNPIYFDGSTRFVINNIQIDQKNSLSIRLKVSASLNSDKFEVYSIELSNAGLIFSEDTNA